MTLKKFFLSLALAGISFSAAATNNYNILDQAPQASSILPGIDLGTGIVTPTGGSASSTLAYIAGKLKTPKDFGVTCDVTYGETALTIAAGATTFTSSDFTSADIGKKLAIFGAGTAHATHYTSISNVVGTTVTIANATVLQVPAHTSTSYSNKVTAGANYAVGDTVTDQYGEIVTITKVSGGAVVDAAVTTQQFTTSAMSNPRTQVSTTGVGTGYTWNNTTADTGRYVYGTDQGALLQTALDSLAATGESLFFPGVRCGTMQALDVPEHNVKLIGSGIAIDPFGTVLTKGSGIIALTGGLSSVIHWEANNSTQGQSGGAEDMLFDGTGGTTNTCYVEKGKYRTFTRVACMGGTASELKYGNGTDTSPPGDVEFRQMILRHNTRYLPDVAMMPARIAYVLAPDARFYGGSYSNGTIIIDDTGFHNNQYYGIDAFGNAPYQPNYCFQSSGTTMFFGGQCGNPSLAAFNDLNDGLNIDGFLVQGGNGVTTGAKGVILASGVTKTNIGGCNSVNVNAGSTMDPANMIVQSGSAGSDNHIECAGASYSQIDNQWFQGGNYGFKNQSAVSAGSFFSAYVNGIDLVDFCYNSANTIGTFGPMMGNCAVSINSTRGVFQIRGNSLATSLMQIARESNDTGPPELVFFKDRGSAAAKVTVASSDQLGILEFRGYDGTSDTLGAYIKILVNASVSSGIVPSTIEFHAFDTAGADIIPFKTSATSITIADGVNITLNTTTGTKIGTGTSQLLGFFNHTPVAQQGATTDLGTVSSNLGLRASGTAYTLTTSGAINFTGALVFNGTDVAITDPQWSISSTGTAAFVVGSYSGILTTSSGQVKATRVIIASGAVTVATSDYNVCINKTSGAATAANLPSSPTTGTHYIVSDCKGDAATNNITVTPAAGNIDGSGTFVVNTNYGSWEGYYTGTIWKTVASR